MRSRDGLAGGGGGGDEEQTSPTIDYRYDSDEWLRGNCLANCGPVGPVFVLMWMGEEMMVLGGVGGGGGMRQSRVMQAARLSRSVGKRVTL